MSVIGETKQYAVLKSETGQISLIPFGWLTQFELEQLDEFRELYLYPRLLPDNDEC